MSFNKNYYQDKQIKLNQSLMRKKDQFLVDVLNLAKRVGDEIQEIQIENQEINKIMEDNKPIKKEK